MKNQKGITLTSLTIYIVIIMIAIVMLATITTYFQKNVTEFNSKSSYDIEFSKFNIYFVEEVKKTGNNVIEPIEATSITFSLGNRYEFKDNAIYLNGSIKIAENISSCKFSLETDADSKKQIIKVSITVNGIERTTEYIIANEKLENRNYVYEYKNVEGTSEVLLQGACKSNLANYKIYGTKDGLGTKINDEEYKIILTVWSIKETDKIEKYEKDEEIGNYEIIINKPLKSENGISEYIEFKNQKIAVISDDYYNEDTMEKDTILPTIEIPISGDVLIEVLDDAGNKPSKINVAYYSN